MGGRFDEGLAARIRDAAGGNPLFVEEMAAMIAEGGSDVVVPPTVQALLAARLDQLDGEERSVLERGAVEGQVFHRGAVQALGAETGTAVAGSSARSSSGPRPRSSAATTPTASGTS